MKGVEYKLVVPRRQAMLSVGESKVLCKDSDIGYYTEHVNECRVPVFVWPIPTQDGFFIVEHQTGQCQKVKPHELTFLGSKELFDQYDWSHGDE